MRKHIEDKVEQYYEEFRGLPCNSPLVRNTIRADAFELAVLDILYGKSLNLSFTKDNAEELSKYIIAPPDEGIDIFIQHESGDEFSFDVIQVKYTSLSPEEMKAAFDKMKTAINTACRNIADISSESCKAVLGASQLDKDTKKNCTYYLIHTGDRNHYPGIDEKNHIITKTDLETILNNTTEYVEEDAIEVSEKIELGASAIVCNINGLDLAELNNKYYSTQAGRNILFGSNLREMLKPKSSKTYYEIEKTINTCPENFWYYNNGITVIAKDMSTENNKVLLKNFSIVNGAQTTSSLGLYLQNSENTIDESERIEALKKVKVLARIIKAPEEKLRDSIAIYNNTQNPITSRDMVSKNIEQVKLNEWLLDENEVQIYMEIRRGARKPNNFRNFYVHRSTTNEELAQLAYAAFFQKPYTSKDKKKTLFTVNPDDADSYTINRIYHDVFHYDERDIDKCGVLFRKSKTEIDEALFVQHLYKSAKKYLKGKYEKYINNQKTLKDSTNDADTIKTCEERIDQYVMRSEAVGICMYYYIATYYEFKHLYDGENAEKVFNYDKFYSDKNYRDSMIKEVAELFLAPTANCIVLSAEEAEKQGNLNNWIRSAACEPKYFAKLRSIMASDIDLEDKYSQFVSQFKS